MKPPNLITLRVWGDFACFTRPEMKVERVSYPVITPKRKGGVEVARAFSDYDGVVDKTGLLSGVEVLEFL